MTFQTKFFSFKTLFIFYLFNLAAGLFIFKFSQYRIGRYRLKKQDLLEQLNILSDTYNQETKGHDALNEKIRRYNKLKDIIEEINQNLNMESISDRLTEISFSLIARDQGVCVLYLLDNQNQQLVLFKAKKEDKKLIIKAKEGDIFDSWVLRHATPLLIEDIKSDFRFDLDKLIAQDSRTINSLISAPLISAHRFLGILRLDSAKTNFFSQDDLRLLVAISDLAAVAIENGELFQRTQDLAIHDELTSLYTKGYFLDRLKEEYKRSVRQERALSLLMLDIDYFKNYNDKFGHSAGDIVLKLLSKTITEELNDLSPIISRFGGEEFCILISGLSIEKAVSVAERLRKKIQNLKIFLRREETGITVSIGVATFPDDVKDEDELVIKADRAMYEAKQLGRNKVCSR